MKGRKPATILAGSSPVDRVPSAPAWLSADAKKEWRRIMPLLVERRILTDADMGGVENYCVAIGRTREIEKLFRKAGGDIDPRLFRMQDKAIQTARQLAAELGLTPVSRSRPSIREDIEDDEENPLEI
jgi:P27 family predicted phage terminase small subunit